MINIPEQFKENMKQLLKEEYPSFIASYEEKEKHSLRINTNKISVKDFLKINPFNLQAIPWTQDGFYYEEDDKPSKHPYYYAGLYYIQEASAMLPAEALPINENDIVLDCCGAPGGKSSKLANKLNNTGLLIANDISVSRSQVLLKTLENQGIKNSVVMAEDITTLNNFNNTFDKILVDAPCSGEGMFRKQPELIKSYLEKGNDYYSDIQKKIISKAVDMLKDGGMLLYSTCTFSPKENEEVIEYALDYCDSLSIIPIKQYEGFMPGITEKTKDCVRLYPHKIKGEGHFVALLQKGNKTQNNEIQNTTINKPNIIKDINIDFNNGSFIQRDNKLYFEPNHNLNLKGLRILRSGLYLGEYKHDKFEMSHALALALNSNQYNNILNFNLDDDRVIKYLKCETLDVKDKYMNGNVLVCVDNYPLGWGNINKGILKNKYPANYRYK